MSPVTDADAPPDALIAPFGEKPGYYADAFRVRIARVVTLGAYISAFYSTPLFRAERLVLRVFARAPSSAADLAALADDQADRFAVWSTEMRRTQEILLGDASGRTKSWLRVDPEAEGSVLWFGSVVVPVERRGRPTLGPVFDALKTPHQVYSRALLGSAAQKLRRAG